MTHNDSTIQIKDVSQHFGEVTALDKVSLSIESKEIHCLLGASGSGKSTLLRVIAGLQNPTSGEIIVGNKTLSSSRTHIPPEKRSIGFVFQDYALFPHLSALRNVLFAIPNRRSAASRQEANRLLAQVGLADRVHSMPHMLSGGEQQRVALARALARHPRIMLLDEPFSGLDTHLRKKIRDLTLSILREKKITSILVTHDAEEALTSADRVSLMKSGALTQTGNAIDVYQYPHDADSAELFGKINQIEAQASTSGLCTEFGTWPMPFGSPTNPNVALIRPENLRLTATTDPSAKHLIDEVTHEGSTHLYRLKNQTTGQTLFSRSLGQVNRLKSGDRVTVTLKLPNHVTPES